MIKVYEYSHLGGSEILQLRYPTINAEIDSVIAAVRLPQKTKVSKEKTMPGKLLYSPVELNRKFRVEFHKRGFRELRDTFDIVIPGYPLTIKNAFKQIDFVRSKVLVEAQFGKYAFMFYDLAKFQYFFNEMKAEAGVEIVPTHALLDSVKRVTRMLVDQLVVELQHRGVKLRDDHIFIVSFVTNQCSFRTWIYWIVESW